MIQDIGYLPLVVSSRGGDFADQGLDRAIGRNYAGPPTLEFSSGALFFPGF